MCSYGNLSMSFFSIGKNEIKKLEKLEKEIDSKLKECAKTYSGNVFNFKDLVLKKEQERLHNKISILKHMNPEDDDDCG